MTIIPWGETGTPSAYYRDQLGAPKPKHDAKLHGQVVNCDDLIKIWSHEKPLLRPSLNVTAAGFRRRSSNKANVAAPDRLTLSRQPPLGRIPLRIVLIFMRFLRTL